MYKLLKVLFIILLLISIIEGGYYFLVLKYPKEATSNNLLPLRPTESYIPTVISQVPKQIFYQEPLANAFIKSEPLQFINNSEVKEGQKFYITFDQSGIVGEVQYTNTSSSSAFIKLVSKSGEKIVKLILNDKIKYYQENSDSGITVIKLSDLKKGDKVVLRLREDLLDSNDKVTEYIKSR